MTTPPPDARVQEAVEAAHKWGMQAPTPLEIEVFARLDAGETEQQYGLDELEGAYACGLLASIPETERLRSALRDARERIDVIAARTDEGTAYDLLRLSATIDSLLTPPRDPQ